MSDLWDVGLVGCRTCGMSDLWGGGESPSLGLHLIPEWGIRQDEVTELS